MTDMAVEVQTQLLNDGRGNSSVEISEHSGVGIASVLDKGL